MRNAENDLRRGNSGEKVRAFLERLDPLLEEAGCGVLMTMETVEVARYAAKKKA
jgi:hypothetical protein